MEQKPILTQPFLSLKHVEKIYPNGEKAVYDFNLDVNKRDFIVIVGPSGCGKSTTLRMIAGLEDITSGDVFLENELLNYKPSKDRKMAIVFQSYALYPQMNVFDNIAFPLTINKYPYPVVDEKLYPLGEAKRALEAVDPSALAKVFAALDAEKIGRKEREERLASALNVTPAAARIIIESSGGKTDEGTLAAAENAISESIAREKARADAEGKKLNENFEVIGEDGKVLTENRALTRYEIKTKVYDTASILDLIPYLDKLPKELSGGQMQRVALGRAIIKNVPIFMMDEPLSNLDAKLRLTMRSEIVKLHNKIDATTIYVTHDQTEAMTMATRIVVMSRGFVQQIGSPKEIYDSPANVFVAKFIGSPSMNVFEGKYDVTNHTVEFGGLTVPLGEEFAARHDAFYAAKEAELAALAENFDGAAREKVLKLLSVTGEGKLASVSSAKKKGVIARIKDKFTKKPVEDEFSAERKILEEKLELVRRYRTTDHALTVGIRPERIEISKKKGKPAAGAFVVKPTVCELLGGEYNVHFDFCGKDAVVRTDAKTPVTTDDEIAVGISPTDAYFFDPVTGEVV